MDPPPRPGVLQGMKDYLFTTKPITATTGTSEPRGAGHGDRLAGVRARRADSWSSCGSRACASRPPPPGASIRVLQGVQGGGRAEESPSRREPQQPLRDADALLCGHGHRVARAARSRARARLGYVAAVRPQRIHLGSNRVSRRFRVFALSGCCCWRTGRCSATGSPTTAEPHGRRDVEGIPVRRVVAGAIGRSRS